MGHHHSKSWSEDDLSDQRGRVFLVTGGNSGIGLQTCKRLARHGATVIMTSRSTKRGTKALTKVKKAAGDANAANVHLHILDLADFGSVRAFADRVNTSAAPFDKGIDTVILNAGVMNLKKYTKSDDGFEMQWQTNVLGHFLLVGLILPTLRHSSRPVVVPVSSLFAHKGRLTPDTDFDHQLVSDADAYSPEPVYSDTKQAALLFATELHKRHGAWLRVMPCHPGASKTNLFRHGWYWMVAPLFQSAGKGSLLELRAATDTSLPPFTYTGTGNAWKGAPRPEAPAASSVNEATAAAMWTACEKATGVTY